MAGRGKRRMPGIIMPHFPVGLKILPGGRAGHRHGPGRKHGNGLSVDTPAGTFEDCVEVLETTPLEPDAESTKIIAPESVLLWMTLSDWSITVLCIATARIRIDTKITCKTNSDESENDR